MDGISFSLSSPFHFRSERKSKSHQWHLVPAMATSSLRESENFEMHWLVFNRVLKAEITGRGADSAKGRVENHQSDFSVVPNRVRPFYKSQAGATK